MDTSDGFGASRVRFESTGVSVGSLPPHGRPALSATEQRDVETALRDLPGIEQFVKRLLERIRPFLDLRPPARVLDIGAAQGVSMIAYGKEGFEVAGVEPWDDARDVAEELAERTGVAIEIVEGVAEVLPFGDGSFDFVHTYSVLEHVDDPDAVFDEVHRVLKPGGGFYFATTSNISPRQNEIRHFPLFPWYPDRVRRAIMIWARDNRPSWVGHTTRPAFFWFRHGEVRRQLEALGFTVINRWQLRAREHTGWRASVIRAAATNRAVRLVADIAVPGVEYLAIKS